MTFIHNQKEKILSDFIKGQILPYPHLVKHENLPLIYNKYHDKNTIPILSGGGSGHEPAHIGYVGDGMLTAAIYGPLFAPPSSKDIADAIRFLDSGKGVFVIIKNFEADFKNFSMAINEVRKEGHEVRYIISHDDISIEPKNNYQIRGRGLAGTVLIHKIIGDLARKGAKLEILEESALELSTKIATIGFATKSAKLPTEEKSLFQLEENYISYGIGIHGEEGYRVVPFENSENLANEIINKLKLHFHWKKNDKFILLVNNLGACTDLEMGIFLNDLSQLLEIEDVDIPLIKLGKYMTSLDMSGISVSLCKISDKTWLDSLSEPTNAFAWK
ncbi:MAG: DhaKLM operon coactivator DhaQ [Gemella sp.]|nr:DhaKLM operon coactivator DhaQ [Gemella sp.]